MLFILSRNVFSFFLCYLFCSVFVFGLIVGDLFLGVAFSLGFPCIAFLVLSFLPLYYRWWLFAFGERLI